MKNRFTNAMQMKAYVKKQSALNNIDPRLLIQEFVLDDLLERISLSPYRDNLVLKGGFLIASLLGIDTRSTHDLDTTVVGMPINPNQLMSVFTKVCQIVPEDDPIELHPVKIERIRDDDKYGEYRVHFEGLIYGKIKPRIKIDVSTGDQITPNAISYQHHLMTEDRTITIAAYNIETILAEKLETIISRGATNSRSKDFYDLYALIKFEYQNIDVDQLKLALTNTAAHRRTLETLRDYQEIIADVMNDKDMNTRWHIYQRDNEFAKNISFQDTCSTVVELLNEILKQK
ncbi:nucleotidyl transferase AbiEii/AbiGii toxin family protein [Lactiplantibacillus pentosus]|uniref:nucleotidyl transferase AbiEii/AbiGii toxin family protein n=1 Tax=Lactiplantibacillus pentosus TaxID=1589 RepID=UPI000EAA1D48|nr:nucleotidyl transferase AbiEii/AbiGii toxin family protein [Lactiplantibacillus pentosus]AYG37982.1 nucleotidyl transferase AbiEii/AbiGii toxin family protein [Lactiplantibacillus pentosus]AYG40640.1 nucleotidyl transferase AbiEii/AbiGii toxin family protein [Lactiplantibacillus pentosus]MCJ8180525.1 nucleotidyl transferase AbiEii/AbiGii toxin family protein [Lactiplantibacillus pentosus]